MEKKNWFNKEVEEIEKELETHREKGLKEEGKVTLVGFGTFSAKKREARTGRNPQSGEEVKIAAGKAPKFKFSKSIKDAVNGK